MLHSWQWSASSWVAPAESARTRISMLSMYLAGICASAKSNSVL